MKKRILIIEPYFGGSHQQFLLGLEKAIDADFVFLTLPARKWKMRMQLAAPWFFNAVKQLKNRYFDTVLFSTFIDVAVFKALVAGLQDWNLQCVTCTYFHENQGGYPSRSANGISFQFLLINFTTALVSDRLAFNSQYNWVTFSETCRKYINKCDDISLKDELATIEDKMTILYPGLDFEDFGKHRKQRNDVPVICWNHRWEHDKNPEEFFSALYALESLGYSFKIVVLGQSFCHVPSCFEKAKDHFTTRILHWGYAESRSDYISLLRKCDIVVSTAFHEFFGVSVIEAVRAGCRPLVPDRLSYTELFPLDVRYRDGELVSRLAQYCNEFAENQPVHQTFNTERFSWSAQKVNYRNWLMG